MVSIDSPPGALDGRGPPAPKSCGSGAFMSIRLGTLWLGSDRALFRMSDGRLNRVAPDRSFGPIDSLTSDSLGNIWFSDGPQMFRWQHGTIERMDVPFQPFEGHISLMYADSSDRIWVAFKEGGFRVLDAVTRAAPRRVRQQR